MSRPPKVSHGRARWPDAYPCKYCGELTNEHVYGDRTAACHECLYERTTPCIHCGRDHHGDCASGLVAHLLDETVAESTARFLVERGHP